MSFEPLERLNMSEVESAEEIQSPTVGRERLVSWLFLVGSLLFVLDGVLENLQGVSLSSVLHISASLLFTVGSLLFMPQRSRV
ncbi:MAG: hypothetical protein AAF268_12545 [Cyanobacteria bacterium P01_A01_bin.3]